MRAALAFQQGLRAPKVRMAISVTIRRSERDPASIGPTAGRCPSKCFPRSRRHAQQAAPAAGSQKRREAP